MKLQSLLKYIPSPFEKEIEGRDKEQELGKEIPIYHIEESDIQVPSLNRLSTQLGQHWAVVGKTGSGKTRFSLKLLEYLRRMHPKVPRYILNSTDDDMPEVHAPLTFYGDTAPDIMNNGTYTQVWVPDTDNLDEYNKWMLKILQARKPAIVLIDEIASLTGNSKQVKILEGHMKLLKQGRKKFITVINETQELARVPPPMFRQMEYYVQFRINNDIHEMSTSRRYLDMTKEDYKQPSAPYGFYLKRSGINSVKEYRSMQELFGNNQNVG